jgi:hypothetical protein
MISDPITSCELTLGTNATQARVEKMIAIRKQIDTTWAQLSRECLETECVGM